MIKASWLYFRDEILPRWSQIIFSSDFFGAIAVGAALGLWGDRLSLGKISIGDISTVFLTYGAIALGFCLAGLTLALTLPDRDFARKLAKTQPDRKKPDSYSDLLFVFSWTAICHWLIILSTLAVLVFGGFQSEIFPIGSSSYRRFAVGLIGALGIYGIQQFVITIITISQVGRIYIQSLHD